MPLKFFIIFIIAGAIITTNIAGRTNNTNGITILTRPPIIVLRELS